MKHLITISGILAVLLIFSLAVNAQEKMNGTENKMPMMDKQKKEQMMTMMQDSTIMKMMMEHIAKDDHMRMKMMHKMMEACKADSSKMMGMCKMMMKDEDMHQMMMKKMHGDEMEQGMMGHGMMKKHEEKARHEKHQMKQKTESDSESTSKEVLVKFKSDTDEAQISSMASEVGLIQVKEIKELNLRVFKVSSQKSVQEVIEHCQKEPYVEYAEQNQKYKTQK